MSELQLTSASILALIQSLVMAELKALRPHQAHQILAEDWDAYTLVHAPKQLASERAPTCLHVDSIERMALVTAVADFFQLRTSGLEDYLLRWNRLGQWAELVEEVRHRGQLDLCFLTSGSEGLPKSCPQAWKTLVDEVHYFAQQWDHIWDATPQRIVALTPCHHIYGFLFSVLLAEYWQVPVIRHHAAFFIVQGRRLAEGDLIVGFPLAWKQIARSGQPFPPGILGLTSTGPCDANVIHQLQAQGLSHMVEIYGSSETAGLGWRTQPTRPFTLLPRWQTQTDPRQLLDTATQTLQPLNDALEWLDAEHFFPRGRLDQAVQVAGMNVFPERIARQLTNCPGVLDARVRLMRPDEGERLKAFIVLKEGVQAEQALPELMRWCRTHLHTAECPVAFTFGASLPVNAVGKDCDWSGSFGSFA